MFVFILFMCSRIAMALKTIHLNVGSFNNIIFTYDLHFYYYVCLGSDIYLSFIWMCTRCPDHEEEVCAVYLSVCCCDIFLPQGGAKRLLSA